MPLINKTVVVTGAGSGLGQALCVAFSKEGCQIIGIGRSTEGLKKTANLAGDAFQYYQADTSDFKQIKNVVSTIIGQFESIDYWFNNAAVYPKVNFLEETSSDFSNTFQINVLGVANCCKAVLPLMIKQNSGCIFNVSSWAHLKPIPNSAAYSSSKGAVHSLTKAIAVDIADTEVQVHEWIPGHLNTQMSNFTGIAPDVAANWAIELIKMPITKKNTIFQENQEHLPPKRLKERIKSKLLFWKK